MAETKSSPFATRPVQVWDAPTRVFHWLLVALILLAWLTGENEAAGDIHRIAGEVIAGMLVFRLAWGFIGGEHARFHDFAAGPSVIAAHIRHFFSKKAERHLGHNPLGGLAVFLLLFTTAMVVITGLFSRDEGVTGPFAGLWGLELSEIHEGAFAILQLLVVIHIIGVVVESWKSGDALVPAMVTGKKHRRADEAGADARRARAWALLIALLLGTATTVGLMSLPGSPSIVTQNSGQDEHD